MNPTDFAEYNPFGTYTIGGQLAYANDKGNVYLNVASGDQDGKLEDANPIGATSAGNTFRVNLNTGWTISEKYYVGLNTSYTNTDVGEVKDVTGIRDSVGDNYGFYGLALYQKLTINDVFMLGLRAEYFSEFKGGVGAIGGYDADGKASVTGITLSANYLSGNFRFIPEFRYDITSEDTFTKESSGAPIATMPSINFAVVYTLPAMNHKIHSKN